MKELSSKRGSEHPQHPDSPGDRRRSLGEIKCEAFDQDVVVNDRQQAFSAELLRLALLGVGGVGYLAARSITETGAAAGTIHMNPVTKSLVLISAVCFGLCAASALALRYVAADLLALQLRVVRLRLRAASNDPGIADAEEQRRNRRLKVTRPLLVAASLLLVLGAAALIGFVFLALAVDYPAAAIHPA